MRCAQQTLLSVVSQLHVNGTMAYVLVGQPARYVLLCLGVEPADAEAH